MKTGTRALGERIIPEFVDEQMGLPVALLDSVKEVRTGNVSGIVVPDLPGLEVAMAVARIMDPFKLNGREIKFLRKAIGIKAVELAKFLDVTAETVSRWENDKEKISTNAERLLRMRTFNALRARARGVKANLDAILEMKFRPLRLADEGMMVFRRALAVDNGSAEDVWLHLGARASNAVTSPQRMRA